MGVEIILGYILLPACALFLGFSVGRRNWVPAWFITILGTLALVYLGTYVTLRSVLFTALISVTEALLVAVATRAMPRPKK